MTATPSAKKIELWPLARLVPYERNARTHSAEQVAQIAASIQEFGFTNPILVDSDDGILAGHGRLAAARDIGMTEVPVIVLDHLSPAQRRAYVLADNKLALNAGWDEELLRLELSDLQLADFDLSLIGFSDDELADLLPEVEELPPEDADADAVPEPPAEPITKPGDVWLMGKHRVMCGDSTSITDVELLMAGAKADMVFTDPPYGMNLDTDYSKLPSTKAEGNKTYSRIAGDDVEYDPSTVLNYFDYCQEIIMFGADYYARLLPAGSWYVWDKRVDEKFDRMIGSAFELAWSKRKHKREIARFNNTLFSGEAEARNKVHPTQKPTKLIEWFFERINALLVVDLYGGSGTTLIACENTSRHCRMMELDPRYCDVIVKRWQEFTGKRATLEATGEQFPAEL